MYIDAFYKSIEAVKLPFQRETQDPRTGSATIGCVGLISNDTLTRFLYSYSCYTLREINYGSYCENVVGAQPMFLVDAIWYLSSYLNKQVDQLAKMKYVEHNEVIDAC